MTDPNREAIIKALPQRALYGKTTAQIASDTGIDSSIVRTTLRALVRGGEAVSISMAMHRRLYGKER